MEKVNAKMIIEIFSNSHKNKYHFDDGWNFKIDRYCFKKINDVELELSFDFEAPIIKKENGKVFVDCPSEFMEEFQKFEEEIERILDLISLETYVELRVKPESYLFFSSSVSDKEFQNSRELKLKDLEGLRKRFHFINYELQQRSIINALRSYRHSRDNADTGDKGLRIYSAIEQIFAKGKHEKLLTGEEFEIVKNQIKKCDLPKNKRTKIINSVRELRAKSVNEMIAEKMDLTSKEGIVSLEEKLGLLNSLKCRHAQAHGEIVPKREFETEFNIDEMENILEYILKDSVVPRMKYYILYKQNIKKSFTDNHGELISDVGNGYFTLCVRDDELEIYEEHLPKELEGDSPIYINWT